jgi:hypothetical protein
VKSLEDFPNRFLVLNDKEGESRLKLKGQLSIFLGSVLSRKTRLSGFAQIEHTYVFSFLVSVDLRTLCCDILTQGLIGLIEYSYH